MLTRERAERAAPRPLMRIKEISANVPWKTWLNKERRGRDCPFVNDFCDPDQDILNVFKPFILL